MGRLLLAAALALILLPTANGPSSAQEFPVIIDSQGWGQGKEDGFTALKAELAKLGLVVKTSAEVTGVSSSPLSDSIISTASLIITDRRESYSPEEIDAIERYIWVGGSLLCSTDSDVSPNFIPAANSLLAPFNIRVSAEGKVGASTHLAEHPITANVSSVVNDDGPINISFGFGTALAQVGDAVVAVASEQGYGKVVVVDADIIYDGVGKNIGLGDNRVFVANILAWLAGGGKSAPPEGEGVLKHERQVICPVCGSQLSLLEGEEKLALAPSGGAGEQVYRFPQPMVAPLKDAGRSIVFGLEIEMPPGTKIDASLVAAKSEQIVKAAAKRFSGTGTADISDKAKVEELIECIQGDIALILGCEGTVEVCLRPLFVAASL